MPFRTAILAALPASLAKKESDSAVSDNSVDRSLYLADPTWLRSVRIQVTVLIALQTLELASFALQFKWAWPRGILWNCLQGGFQAAMGTATMMALVLCTVREPGAAGTDHAALWRLLTRLTSMAFPLVIVQWWLLLYAPVYSTMVLALTLAFFRYTSLSCLVLALSIYARRVPAPYLIWTRNVMVPLLFLPLPVLGAA